MVRLKKFQKNEHTSLLRDKCNFIWNNTKLNQIKKSTSRWENPKLEQNGETILIRLRIGHTRLTHGFLMTKEEPPAMSLCEAYGVLCSQ